MTKSPVLSRSFYSRETVDVAMDLLAKNLVRVEGGTRMKARIVEVEAYRGGDDPASHAFRGMTQRNAPMFGQPGHAYVYFTYGNHYCLNVTTQPIGIPGAVLIRAVEPLKGIVFMRRHRPGVPDLELTNGPGKLTKALRIDKSLNEVNMTRLGPLYITHSEPEAPQIVCTSRVGIRQGTARMWRFCISGNPYVSRA